MAQAVRHGDRLRALALAGLVVALALTGWRGAEILTTNRAAAPVSPAEAQLLPLAEALAGPGQVRLMLSRDLSGARQLTVLMDVRAADRQADVARLLAVAAGLDSERGERIFVETAPFAAGLAGRPGPAGWAELGGLALLALICAVLGFAPQREAPPAPALRDGRIEPELVAAAPPARRPAPQVRLLQEESGEAAALARQDPAAAASVLRLWMKETDAA